MALFKTVAYLEVQNLFQIWFQLEYTAEFPPSQELLYFSVREILLGRGLIWTNELYSFVSFSVSFFYLLFCLLCSPPLLHWEMSHQSWYYKWHILPPPCLFPTCRGKSWTPQLSAQHLWALVPEFHTSFLAEEVRTSQEMSLWLPGQLWAPV